MNAPVTPRERPILFSGEMVRQILDGKKTQTRRPIGLSELRPSTTPGYDWAWRGTAPVRSIAQQRRYPDGCWQDVSGERLLSLCPFGAPGDRLWVRETWAPHEPHPCSTDIPGRGPEVRYEDLSPTQRAYWARRVIHRATATTEEASGIERWRPSIHMPRWASRLMLEVTGVRVERLHDISYADILAEGVTREVVAEMLRMPIGHIPTLHDVWRLAWTHIYGAESWEANPWLWVVEFRRVEADR